MPLFRVIIKVGKKGGKRLIMIILNISFKICIIIKLYVNKWNIFMRKTKVSF